MIVDRIITAFEFKKSASAMYEYYKTKEFFVTKASELCLLNLPALVTFDHWKKKRCWYLHSIYVANASPQDVFPSIPKENIMAFYCSTPIFTIVIKKL